MSRSKCLRRGPSMPLCPTPCRPSRARRGQGARRHGMQRSCADRLPRRRTRLRMGPEKEEHPQPAGQPQGQRLQPPPATGQAARRATCPSRGRPSEGTLLYPAPPPPAAPAGGCAGSGGTPVGRLLSRISFSFLVKKRKKEKRYPGTGSTWPPKKQQECSSPQTQLKGGRAKLGANSTTLVYSSQNAQPRTSKVVAKIWRPPGQPG